MKAHVQYTDALNGRLDPPSSKNYTTRYLLVAALAQGQSRVRFPAVSDDAAAMERCLRLLGAGIEEERDEQGRRHLLVRGFGDRPANPGVLNPGNAGAVLRLLIGVGALLPEVRFETDFAESLGTRPHGDLLAALEQLGVRCQSDEGRLPIVLRGGALRGGKVEVSGAKSSQYLSALLFMAPLVGQDIQISVTGGLVSAPLVRTTLEVMAQAGIQVEAAADLMHFGIAGGQRYQPSDFTVNGDYPSSAAVLGAAAITGGDVTVERLYDDLQGERAVVPLLRSMGAAVERQDTCVRLAGGHLQGVQFDGDAATDMVLAMVAVAALAKGESRFYGIANLRLKECDRISVPVRELRRIGVDCDEGEAEIVVRGRPEGYEGGIEVDTHHDHRVAQMLTLVGLRCRRGLVVRDAETVGKSYPDFFADLTSLGARIRMED